MTNEVKIVLTAEDKASANIKKVEDGLRELRAESEKLKDARMFFADDSMAQNATKADASIGGLSATVSQLQGAFLALGLERVVSEMGAMIERSDKLATAMASLGGRSIDAAREFTAGVVPAMDLVSARTRLMQAGLEVTGDEFAALVAKGAAFGIATGDGATSGVQQLTAALISGTDRGLRPFGIEIRNTTERAGVQSQALEQLATQYGRNRAAVEESRGALDLFGGVLEDVEADVGTLLRTLYDDAPVVFGRNLIDLGKVLIGRESLSDASRSAQERVNAMILSFTQGTPVIGGLAQQAVALSGRLRAAAESAGLLSSAIANIPDLPESGSALLRSTFRRGGAMLGAGEENYRGAPRNRAEWMRQNYPDDPTGSRLARAQQDAISEALSAPERGGGGGGGGRGDRPGARGDIDWRISTAERERLRAEAEAREDALTQAARDEAEEGGLYGTDEGLRVFDARGNARGQGGNTRARGDARSTRANQFGATIDNLKALERTQTLVMGNMTSAVQAHAQAWLAGEETIGQAIKGIVKSSLAGVALEATVKAIMATAEGLFLLATSFGTNPAAEVAFSAAAYYTAAAVAAGGAALAVGAIGGGSKKPSASTHGRDDAGRSTTRDLGARRETAPGPTVIFNLSPGAIVGLDQRAAEDWLQQRIRNIDTRDERQRRFRARA